MIVCQSRVLGPQNFSLLDISLQISGNGPQIYVT